MYNNHRMLRMAKENYLFLFCRGGGGEWDYKIPLHLFIITTNVWKTTLRLISKIDFLNETNSLGQN